MKYISILIITLTFMVSAGTRHKLNKVVFNPSVLESQDQKALIISNVEKHYNNVAIEVFNSDFELIGEVPNKSFQKFLINEGDEFLLIRIAGTHGMTGKILTTAFHIIPLESVKFENNVAVYKLNWATLRFNADAVSKNFSNLYTHVYSKFGISKDNYYTEGVEQGKVKNRQVTLKKEYIGKMVKTTYYMDDFYENCIDNPTLNEKGDCYRKSITVTSSPVALSSAPKLLKKQKQVSLKSNDVTIKIMPKELGVVSDGK